MRKNKLFIVLVGLVLGFILFFWKIDVSRHYSSQTPTASQECSLDSDCAPDVGCGSLICVNKHKVEDPKLLGCSDKVYRRYSAVQNGCTCASRICTNNGTSMSPFYFILLKIMAGVEKLVDG